MGVVSRAHVMRGVKGGFARLGHGKEAPLRRLAAGDRLIYYSPRTAHPDGAPLQAFTAIGEVEDEDVFQGELTATFRPCGGAFATWRPPRYRPRSGSTSSTSSATAAGGG